MEYKEKKNLTDILLLLTTLRGTSERFLPSQTLKIYGSGRKKCSLGASSRSCAQTTIQQVHNPFWISSRC